MTSNKMERAVDSVAMEQAANDVAVVDEATGNEAVGGQGLAAMVPASSQTELVDVVVTEQVKERALNRAMMNIMRAVGPIAKNMTCDLGKGRSYKFRGIDDVYNHMHWLLMENGLYLQQEVVKCETRDCMCNNRPARLVHLEIRYIFCHELGGTTSSVIVSEAVGDDNKVVGRAQSYAYKRLMFDTFCIPIAGQMPDESNIGMIVNTNVLPLQDAGKAFPIQSAEEEKDMLKLAARMERVLARSFGNNAGAMLQDLGRFFNKPMGDDASRKGLSLWLNSLSVKQQLRYLEQAEINLTTNLGNQIVNIFEQAFFHDYGAIASYMAASLKLKGSVANRQELLVLFGNTSLEKLCDIADFMKNDLEQRFQICVQVRKLRREYFDNDSCWMLAHLCNWLGRPLPAGKSNDNLKIMLAALDTDALASYLAQAVKDMQVNRELRQKLADVCASRFDNDYDKLMADMASCLNVEAPDGDNVDYSGWLWQFGNGQLREYLDNFRGDSGKEKLVQKCLEATERCFDGNMRAALAHAGKLLGGAPQTFSQMSDEQMRLWLGQVQKEAQAKTWLIRICDRRFGGDRQKLLADMSGFIGGEVASLDAVKLEYREAYIQAQRESMTGPDYEGFWDKKGE